MTVLHLGMPMLNTTWMVRAYIMLPVTCKKTSPWQDPYERLESCTGRGCV